MKSTAFTIIWAVVFLVCQLPLLPAQDSVRVLSMDPVLDWDRPLGMSEAELVKRFPVGENESRWITKSRFVFRFNNLRLEETGLQLRMLAQRFEVSSFAAYLDKGVVNKIELLIRPEGLGKTLPKQSVVPEFVNAMNEVLGSSAQIVGKIQTSSKLPTDLYQWTLRDCLINLHNQGVGYAKVTIIGADAATAFVPTPPSPPGQEPPAPTPAVPTPPSMPTVPAPGKPTPAPPAVVSVPNRERQALAADLDFLLNYRELWNWTTEVFEEHYTAKDIDQKDRPPQFEWLTAAKERARFSRRMFSNMDTKLTMFGGSMKVEEATVEFVRGRVARATVSFYNRGDSGEIEGNEFEQRYKRIGQNLGQVFKVPPKNQLMSANAAVKTIGWNWTTPQGIALLEYNDYSRSGRPEFLRLKLAAPDQADWSMGRLSVGVQRMALVKNVTRTPAGDVYIAGVPMVDQGAKGYCVAASCQRLFEYMQIPCDQHEMAQLLNVDAERGANAIEMQKSLAKVDGRFNVAFKPLVNPELYYDGKGKRRVSLKEFAKTVKENADKGVPLLWALQLGLAKEDPPLPGGGQVSGGHMRMIIGYNSEKNQILFTDSWGAGHELKRVDASDAYEATLGLYSMSPRGL